ncbi:MAG: hypothetical protein IPL21_03775 [Saprospirales bacterium]|jgi:hypothetical protein|nr:hypothetical protein [Saprospirales bacterium]
MTHVLVNENTKEGKELLLAITKLPNTVVEVLEDEDAELIDTISFDEWSTNLRNEVKKRFEK